MHNNGLGYGDTKKVDNVRRSQTPLILCLSDVYSDADPYTVYKGRSSVIAQRQRAKLRMLRVGPSRARRSDRRLPGDLGQSGEFNHTTCQCGFYDCYRQSHCANPTYDCNSSVFPTDDEGDSHENSDSESGKGELYQPISIEQFSASIHRNTPHHNASQGYKMVQFSVQQWYGSRRVVLDVSLIPKGRFTA